MASNAAADTSGLEVQELFLEVNSLANRLKWLESPRTMLPAGERAILQCLIVNGSLTVPQLARARCTSRQNAQVLVNRLRQRGLVEVLPNPAHQRSSLVATTPAALGLAETVNGEYTQLIARVQAVCPLSEIRAAVALLRQLRAVIGNASNTAAVAESATAKSAHSQHLAADPTSPQTDELPVNLL